MRAFAYERPSSEIAAVRAASALAQLPLVNGRAPVEYLAGGTTLVDLMKLDVMRPARVVDLGAIAGAHDASQHHPTACGLALWSRCRPRPTIRRSSKIILSLPKACSRRRARTASQYGDAWRQPAAADSVSVFSRYVLGRLRQA